MEITYLGHSSFRFKTRGVTLVTDPFDSKMMGIKYPKVTADIVTISHDHDDHNAESEVKNTRKVVKGPGEYEISGISIIGLPSYHDDKKGELRGKNTIYVFEIEDYRIAHLGDLGHPLSENEISALGDINILMVPVGGEYTIGPSQAVEIVQALEPNFVIPMHFGLPDLNQEAFGKLAPIEEFLKLMALTVEETDKLTLKGELGEEQKIVKLRRQNG